MSYNSISMSEKTKENIIIALCIFTFIIPVIPMGLIYGYQALFPPSTSSENTKPNTFQAGEDSGSSEDYDPYRSSGAYSSGSSSSVYECSSDCSGHEAGYEWAGENDVCDPYYEGGSSESFDEGVRAYGEENCPDESEYDEDYDYYR